MRLWLLVHRCGDVHLCVWVWDGLVANVSWDVGGIASGERRRGAGA